MIDQQLLEATGDASNPQDVIDPTFRADIGFALWSMGVDVTQMDVATRQQLELALWQDPFLQHAWLADSAGPDITDPTSGGIMASNFSESFIKAELFDPTKSHNAALLSQGATLLQLSGRQLPASLQNYASNLGGGNPQITNAIAQAAQESGVPYSLLLATAMAESGLNPKAVGDHGTSFGLFQLHEGGELGNLTQTEAEDPLTNARRAAQGFVQAKQQDPSVASDFGRWAAAAQRPSDPSGYATRVDNLLQSSFGGAPSSLVPRPFDGNFPITEDHNQGDPGIDYGTPVGTPMYTPFAGTIRVEDSGKTNWGKRAMVVLDNGYTFAIGHLTSFSVSDGQRVNPGTLLGLSGGATGDPSSGITTGPHVELQWISPGGNFLDPHVVLDPIFAGSATFRSLQLSGAEGSGVSAASAQNRALGIDPLLESKYPTAVSQFEKYFGRHPTSQELMRLIQHGTTAAELDGYLRSQPSHVPGVSMGMYQDVKSNADSVSNQVFGHGVTDGMVKELVDQGKTDQASVQFWLTQQDFKGKMDPKDYQSLWALNQPHMQAIYGQSNAFDPRIAMQQHAVMQQQGIAIPAMTPTPSSGGLTYGGKPLGGPLGPDVLMTPAEADAGVRKTIQDYTAGVF